MTKVCMGCMEKMDSELLVCPHCEYEEGTPVEEALHMEPGTVLRDRYIVGRVLGFGGFGVTYIGWDAVLESKVAIKEYLPSEFSTRMPGHSQVSVFNAENKIEQFQDGLAKFIEEAKRLAKFHQEDGIVRIFDSFEDNNTAYIIMDYLKGETLANYLKRENTIPVDKAIAMMMPVIESLKTINGQGILHRDIAPDNIFLTDDGKIKLIDFGAARFATTSHSRSLTVIIKPGYSPEEQYRSRGDQGSYTDVYAIGATLYRMITGITPPDALERRAHCESKKKDTLKPLSKFTGEITENQESAILNALNVRIEDRTQDMASLAEELNTQEPEKVQRKYGKIKKIDVLKWPLWAKIGVPVAMFSIAMISMLFAMGVIGFESYLQTAIIIPDGMTRVPSVINNELLRAEERLNDATLLFVITGREYSEYVPADLVLNQNVNAGTVVLYNTRVEATVSALRQDVIFNVAPDVLFLEEEEATQLIEYAGLTVSVSHRYSEIVMEGLVISQDPAAGTQLDPGDAVHIVISIGGATFALPDVSGLSEAEAIAVLTESGLTVSVNYETSDTAEGQILSQDILAGEELRRGDAVTITVATERDLTQVADVRGMTERTATSTLRGQGFAVTVNQVASETVSRGAVISQSPSAGSSQINGSLIMIAVSTGPPAAVTSPSPTPAVATTPTPSPGRTPTPAPTSTPGRTPTPGPTSTPGITSTPTPSPTSTPGRTPTPTPSPTSTPGRTPTPTPSPTSTPGITPTPTPTPTSTPGRTPTPSPSPTPTPAATPTPSPTPTPAPTPTPTPAPTPTPTPSPTPTPVPTPTPSPAPTPTPSPTPAPTPTPSPTPMPPTPSPTPRPPTPSPSPTPSPAPTPTPSPTPPPSGGQWSPDISYNTGDIVMHNGLEYRARWWAEGNRDRPDEYNANSPWELMGNPVLQWRSDIQHRDGAVVSYNGNIFRARWQNGETPDPDNEHGPWELTG